MPPQFTISGLPGSLSEEFTCVGKLAENIPELPDLQNGLNRLHALNESQKKALADSIMQQTFPKHIYNKAAKLKNIIKKRGIDTNEITVVYCISTLNTPQVGTSEWHKWLTENRAIIASLKKPLNVFSYKITIYIVPYFLYDGFQYSQGNSMEWIRKWKENAYKKYQLLCDDLIRAEELKNYPNIKFFDINYLESGFLEKYLNRVYELYHHDKEFEKGVWKAVEPFVTRHSELYQNDDGAVLLATWGLLLEVAFLALVSDCVTQPSLAMKGMEMEIIAKQLTERDTLSTQKPNKTKTSQTKAGVCRDSTRSINEIVKLVQEYSEKQSKGKHSKTIAELFRGRLAPSAQKSNKTKTSKIQRSTVFAHKGPLDQIVRLVEALLRYSEVGYPKGYPLGVVNFVPKRKKKPTNETSPLEDSTGISTSSGKMTTRGSRASFKYGDKSWSNLSPEPQLPSISSEHRRVKGKGPLLTAAVPPEVVGEQRKKKLFDSYKRGQQPSTTEILCTKGKGIFSEGYPKLTITKDKPKRETTPYSSSAPLLIG